MEIRWKASLSSSCLHAVYCRARGIAGVDDQLVELIAEPADELTTIIADNQLEVVPTLAVLASLASEYDYNRRLVEVSLTRLAGSRAVNEHAQNQLAAAIGGLETRLLAARPEMVDNLALRGQLLQQQWRARGPGLLKQIEKLTAANFVAPAAEVVFVTPWAGGFGRADLKANRVIFEALLADPHPGLPEVVRLGWLMAQLQADVPLYGEVIAAHRLADFAALAAIPIALTAAEAVEWAECTLESIEQAIRCWHIETAGPRALAEKLLLWWQTYRQRASTWEVAWRALEPLLR